MELIKIIPEKYRRESLRMVSTDIIPETYPSGEETAAFPTWKPIDILEYTDDQRHVEQLISLHDPVGIGSIFISFKDRRTGEESIFELPMPETSRIFTLGGEGRYHEVDYDGEVFIDESCIAFHHGKSPIQPGEMIKCKLTVTGMIDHALGSISVAGAVLRANKGRPYDLHGQFIRVIGWTMLAVPFNSSTST